MDKDAHSPIQNPQSASGIDRTAQQPRSYFGRTEDEILAALLLGVAGALVLVISLCSQIVAFMLQACRGSDDVARLFAFLMTCSVCVGVYRFTKGRLTHPGDKRVVVLCIVIALLIQAGSVLPIDARQICPNQPSQATTATVTITPTVTSVPPTPTTVSSPTAESAPPSPVPPTVTAVAAPQPPRCFYLDEPIKRGTYYTARVNDMGTCIAERACVPFSLIESAPENAHIENWDLLYPGDVIYIP